MITIFACPKPFKGHIDVIQWNAITSWTLLRPKPEIILFGNEPGTEMLCNKLGLRFIPTVVRNQHNTPMIDDLFKKGQQLATHHLICYVNADIILLSDFMKAVTLAATWNKDFVLSGARYDLSLDYPINFNQGNWEQILKQKIDRLCLIYGKKWILRNKNGADYFVFRKGFFSNLPPFLLGRWRWDGWMLQNARLRGARLIDATFLITAIHQNHDYGHVHTLREERPWYSEEAQYNLNLGGIQNYYYLWEATHELTHRGLKRVWFQKQIFIFRSALEDFIIYRLGKMRHKLGLRQNTLKLVKSPVDFFVKIIIKRFQCLPKPLKKRA